MKELEILTSYVNILLNSKVMIWGILGKDSNILALEVNTGKSIPFQLVGSCEASKINESMIELNAEFL